MSAAEFVLILDVAMIAMAAYCGSSWSATGPIRHHAEWIGAVAGGSAVTCTAYLLYLITTGKT